MPGKYSFFLLLILVMISHASMGQLPPVENELEVSLSEESRHSRYGDSWKSILSKKKGSVTILYTHNMPFIYRTDDGLAGIEYEVMNGFLDFAKTRYGIELEVSWQEEPSFREFYNKVKNEENGVLGISSVSITKARLNEVKFSPPYIPDIEIIISSGNLPMANTMAEFSEMVRNNMGITLHQSTFEENFKYIKKNYFPHLTYDYSPNLGSIMDTLANNDNMYAYVQITNYGKALDKEENVKRQRFFMVENPGLGMVMPYKSDWIDPVEAYFRTPGFQPLLDSLTVKYLGQTTTTLINEVTRDTSKVDYEVHLGNEIQLLTAESEIQRLKLEQKELEINAQKETTRLLSIGIIAVVILGGVLFFYYKRQRYHNRELALKNIEIARTAKSLKKSYRDLELLSEAGKDITSNLTFSRIIKNVWRNIDALIGTDKFGIGVYNRHNNTLVFKGAREGDHALPTFDIKIDPKSYLAAYCFDHQQEIFINDFDVECMQYIPQRDNSEFMTGAKSIIMFPLIVNGVTNGVIVVQRKEQNSFTDYHFRLLRNLSVYANIALQNAGAFEELAIKSRRLKLANDSITEQKLQIEKQNEDLVQLDHEKNHLIGIVAHDLRSPLSSVMGIINLIQMQGGALAEGSNGEYINLMHTALNRMRDLVTRILDLHKIESREINIDLEKTNISEVLRETYETFVERATEKNIRLILETDNAFCDIDKAYAIQIFENLISNAIKFSPKYKDVRIRIVKQADHTQILVIDDGPGISEIDQKKLFGRFQRLSAQPTCGEQSVGLGLSIVKKFVDLMGGEIWCESQIGHGATFIVQFKNSVESEKHKVTK